MNETRVDNSRQLGLDSSNLLMEWDGLWVLGRYEEATLAVRDAGHMRRRMGEMCLEQGEFAVAAGDWLSATACYVQASARLEANATLQLVRRLDSQGHVPADRADLRAALKEREDEIHTLKEKEEAFGLAVVAKGIMHGPASEEHLDFLLRQVRDLPGFALLHGLVADQAIKLGRQELAEKHFRWANAFAPDNERFAASYGTLLSRAGRVEEAEEVGRRFLAIQPGSVWARLLVARTLTMRSGPGSPGREEAIALLRPVVGSGEPTAIRVAALALSLQLQREFGRQAEAAHLVAELGELERATADAELRSMIANVRQVTAVSTNGASSAPSDGLSPTADSEQRLFAILDHELFNPAA